MKLGEFIKNFSHNNIIRLWYKEGSDHRSVAGNCNNVSMDHDVINQKGIFRDYINNEVLSLITVVFHSSTPCHYPEALNIVIEELEDQPVLEDLTYNSIQYESC